MLHWSKLIERNEASISWPLQVAVTTKIDDCSLNPKAASLLE